MDALLKEENHEWVRHENPIPIQTYPKWFHPHGEKFEPFLDLVYQLQLAASAEKLDITIVKPAPLAEQKFKLEWEIVHFGNEGVWGRSIWTRKMLECAFGLDHDCHITGIPFIDRFGGISAYAGKYIRHDSFLNIPGPGYGNDGEANLSIKLTPEIQDAVKNFLNYRTHLSEMK